MRIKEALIATGLTGLFLAFGTGRAEAGPPPTGLAGTAIGTSSITWTWNIASGASAYNLYIASSPTTVIADTVPTNSYTETGLSTNTAYSRVATAIHSGVPSSLSSPATAYTLAAAPGTPAFSSIGISSATLTWNARGNPSTTLYEVSRSTLPSFNMAISTSITFVANFTNTTTTFFNLAPGTTYYFRVRAMNGDYVITAFSSVSSVTTEGSASGGGAGVGTATILPSNVPEASVATTTVTFTIPAAGMTAGGRLEITMPSGWGPYPQTTYPSQSGYVVVVGTVATNFNVYSTSQSVNLTLYSGFLAGGTQIPVAFQMMYPNCPTAALPQAVWKVKSAMTTTDALSDLASAPSPQSYTAGPFQSLSFVPWSVVTVAAGQPSQALLLQASDGCGLPLNVAAPLTVNLTALLPDSSTTDPSAQFSNVSNFATTTTTATIPASSSTTVFYYQAASAGNNRWIKGSYTHPIYASNYQVWRQVNVLTQSFTFANVSVDSGTPVNGQTSMTISPDGDGANDQAYIRFNPTDTNPVWHVAISSDNFQSTLFDRWGSSNPLSSVLWDGRDYRTGYVVANGTYSVKLEVEGLATDTSLLITVNTARISGSVTLGGSPVAGAQVNAQAVSVSGYSAARTDANGTYNIFGLRSGAVYNLYTYFTSTATQAQINGQLNNVTAPATGRNFTLSSPGVVRISAVSPTAAPATVYGSVNLYTSTQNFWGNVRLLPGTTTSDNGDSFNPSTWTIIGLPPGSYTLRLNMQGYGAMDQPVTVSAGSSQDIVINLAARASIFGKITLSTAPAVPLWVSVQGVLLGNTFPTVYGGVSFNSGQTTGIYTLYAVSPGTYAITAQITGYTPQKTTGVVVGAADIGDSANGGIDFSSFTTGGNISGSLTINGNTLSQPTPMMMWINAFSPQFGQNAFTQVQMTPNATQSTATYVLAGLADGTYQVNPPFLQGFGSSSPGPQSVTVSGGVGTLNLVLNENTGSISGAITLPGANSDYNNVHLSLQGPINREVDLTSGPGYALNQLDTGYYRLVATYLTTGAQATVNTGVTNGQTQTANLDLGVSTYSVSGTVSVQSGFTMNDSSGSVVTVNTIPELLAGATQQTLLLGGTPGYGTTGFQCNGGTATVLTTARVEAFPKTFNSFDQANRNGLTNCFGVGQYKYGALAADGSYSISGLTPGLWEVSVYPYFDNGTSPNVAVLKQVVSILTSNVSGTNFALSNGNNVSGTLNLPAGVTDNRAFNVQVVSDRGDTVQSAFVEIGSPGNPAASTSFSFTRLPTGNYSIVLRDPGTYDSVLQRNVVKYVAQPVQFQITGGDVSNVTVTLSNAGRIVGKLAIHGANPDGTPALTLITPSSQNLLPDNFNISAQANPWVPSGYVQANRQAAGSKIDIDADNQFSIDGLIAGTYDVSFRQDTFGNSTQGSLNLAGYTQGAVVVAQGQTLDLGTISLQPGLSLSGTVTNTSGTPLPNIRVRAQPSNNQHGNDGQEAFTNSAGRFTFTGLSPTVKIYDFVAAPRPYPGETVQPVPYGQMKRLSVDVTQVPQPTLTFSLPSATAGFTGQITTVDGGALSYPMGEREGYPAAAVFVNLEGNNTADNPLGDENATALDGSFNITNLPPGIYSVTVEALGYRPIKLTGQTLTSTMKNLGTLTLQRGPSLQATLTKPDGSAVNTNDVRQAVAASADLSSIIFGQINSDAQTNNILSIKFAGFELSPKTYSILLFDKHDNIIVPPDGKGLVFTANNDSVAKALTFQPTAPLALVNVQKSGSDVLITFYLSRPLRNGPEDQDPSAWVTRTSGSGSLSAITLSGDRRQLTATYTPVLGEQNATIQLTAHTVDIDLTTGVEFVITKSVALLLGQKATAEQTINPAMGGEVSLSDSLDPSNVSIPANALLNTSGSAADATTSYAFTLSATDDATSVGAGALHGAPRVAGMMGRGPSAYLSEAYAAMQTARATANVNPLSSFYSILLPAGLSHTLNQSAVLTLSYDTDADPSQINIYYFNGSHYLLEQALRSVDTVNHTITVSVSHFSTFVVLENNAPVVVLDGDISSGGDIEVFNFPNPFDLQTKTKTLNHGGATTSITTDGTVIRFTIPAAMAGAAKIDIYNIIGEKVRSLDLGVPATDIFHYTPWDGRNDSGKKVASGVYIGMLKVGSNKKFFKMAVIK